MVQEANRLAMAAAQRRAKEDPAIYVGSDDSEEEEVSPTRRRSSRKRKMETEEDIGDLSEETRRKQGRPQTTGLYVARAEAQEVLNAKKREAADLDSERVIKSMSTGEIFSKVETDLDEAVCGMRNTPTADIANQARECMAGVLKVAKCNKNLKDGFVKILRHAAVVGSATAEVLRTRADCSNSSEPESETSRQIKTLRNELQAVKREAQLAREEAESLRKELAEEREKGRRRTRGRIIIENSPPRPRKGREGQKRTARTGTWRSPWLEEILQWRSRRWRGWNLSPKRRWSMTMRRRSARYCRLRKSGRRPYARPSRGKLRS